LAIGQFASEPAGDSKIDLLHRSLFYPLGTSTQRPVCVKTLHNIVSPAMSRQITSLTEISPKWLTNVLRNEGIITNSTIESIAFDTSNAATEDSALVNLSYENKETVSGPASVFIKFCRQKNESVFYQHIAPTLPATCLIPDLSISFCNHDASGYIILADISDTHRSLLPNALPTTSEAIAAVSALATLHTTWWDHPDLENKIQSVAEDMPGLQKSVAKNHFESFVDYVGDDLSVNHRHVYESLLYDSSSKMHQRFNEKTSSYRGTWRRTFW